MAIHPLITNTPTRREVKAKSDRCIERQRQLLDWLDGLIADAEQSGSAVVVIGTAVVKGVRQQINDSVQANS